MNFAGGRISLRVPILASICAFGLILPELSAATPNIVLILADDLGYGDLRCYGGKLATPNLDRMAKEGVRFADFYVSQPVCSASRAALMTGRYANRVGIFGALGPKSTNVLPSAELTIAEVLKTRGYTNAIYGKWHLGDSPGSLPPSQGFDDYYGLPYSNDMWPHHPVNPERYPPLPLIEGEKVVQTMPDQTQLTKSYTERAVKFIENSKDRPFFLYLAHNMPHVPLFVSDSFKGKSGAGLYGDVIAELDWSVGQILQTVKSAGLDENTLVMFTSDNGPWLLYGNHAGSAGPLREGKATAFEGGFRVPFLARWPKKIPAGTVCRELATTLDVLPTVAGLAGAEVNVRLDGQDIWSLMSRPRRAKTPHEVFYYYWGRELHAVRSGRWKLHFKHPYTHPDPAGSDGKPGKNATAETALELYDLKKDAGERVNVAHSRPQIVKLLEDLADQARQEFGDTLLRRRTQTTTH
jgi:arylsulfatase A